MKTKYPFYYTYLFLAVIFSLLTSCDNDDETYNVVGLWYCGYIQYGTDKYNIVSEDNFFNAESGDVLVEADSDGKIRILYCRLQSAKGDTIYVKDGTYTTDGKTITTNFDGEVETYTIEDSRTLSTRKHYKGHDNAYVQYSFAEIRYEYDIFLDTLKYYVTIPKERLKECRKQIDGCYQILQMKVDGKFPEGFYEYFFWFLPDNKLKYTEASYILGEDPYKHYESTRETKVQYGTYRLYSNNDSLSIELGGREKRFKVVYKEVDNVSFINLHNDTDDIDCFSVEDDTERHSAPSTTPLVF